MTPADQEMIEALVAARRSALEGEARAEQLEEERLDLTELDRGRRLGHRHVHRGVLRVCVIPVARLRVRLGADAEPEAARNVLKQRGNVRSDGCAARAAALIYW